MTTAHISHHAMLDLLFCCLLLFIFQNLVNKRTTLLVLFCSVFVENMMVYGGNYHFLFQFILIMTQGDVVFLDFSCGVSFGYVS